MLAIKDNKNKGQNEIFHRRSMKGLKSKDIGRKEARFDLGFVVVLCFYRFPSSKKKLAIALNGISWDGLYKSFASCSVFW